MRYAKLQDRVYRGLGQAARQTGERVDVFRPLGDSDPLNLRNRFIRLHAAFFAPAGGDPYQHPLWQGCFDASYTRHGDYLVAAAGTFFVAAQEPMQPIICVRTNRTITIGRPDQNAAVMNTAYGGYSKANTNCLISGFPASVIGENRSTTATAGLPADQPAPYWNIYLPSVQNIVLAPGDFVSDDLHRTAVIVSAELAYLGWRLSAKVATA